MTKWLREDINYKVRRSRTEYRRQENKTNRMDKTYSHAGGVAGRGEKKVTSYEGKGLGG